MQSSMEIQQQFNEQIERSSHQYEYKLTIMKRIIQNIQRDQILFLQIAYIFLSKQQYKVNDQIQIKRKKQLLSLFQDIVLIINIYQHRKQCLQNPKIWRNKIIDHCQNMFNFYRDRSSILSRFYKLSLLTVEDIIIHMERNQPFKFYVEKNTNQEKILKIKKWDIEEEYFLKEIIINWSYMGKHLKTLLRYKTRSEIRIKCRQMGLKLDNQALNIIYEKEREQKLQRLNESAIKYYELFE